MGLVFFIVMFFYHCTGKDNVDVDDLLWFYWLTCFTEAHLG